MQQSTLFTLALLSLVLSAFSQISLPFNPISQLRLRFNSVVTDLKLNIYQNTFSSLKCAPNVTITYAPKQNSYLSYYVVEWTYNGENKLYKKVDIGMSLMQGQTYSIVEKIATFNCKYGGHSELNYKSGRYNFTITLNDNNKRVEVIGKVSFAQQLDCIKMNSGCWVYTACDSFNTDCDATGSEEEMGQISQME